jgi:hypothetical protein
MSDQVCLECNHSYNLESVQIPKPIPDNMCSNCGTILLEEEIAALEAN